LDAAGDFVCVGNAMSAAKKLSGKPSEKFSPDMFGDIPILKRKWQAALRPGVRHG